MFRHEYRLTSPSIVMLSAIASCGRSP